MAELTFDLKREDEAPLWWGARAIFERHSKYQLRFLQSWGGGTQAQRQALAVDPDDDDGPTAA